LVIREGRTTVYNYITSKEKLDQVNPINKELENDFIEYLVSVDRAKSTIEQYIAALHIFWVWNLDYNYNTAFTELTKRQIARFQNHALNEYRWSSARIRFVKSVCRSLENYILNILDDEYPDYKQIWNKIESPVNEPVRVKSIFNADEMQSLLDYLVEHEQYEKACFLALALNSGRRKSELARFKVSYFTDDNLICDGALYKSPEKIVTKGRGSKGKLLYVYTLAKPFKPYLDLWIDERKKLGITSDWLFPKCVNGTWVDEPTPVTLFNSFANTFTRILGRAWYVHNARHYFTTSLSENNIPNNVIKDIVGWANVSMVDIYNDSEAEDTFEKYFGAEGIKKVEQKSLEDL